MQTRLVVIALTTLLFRVAAAAQTQQQDDDRERRFRELERYRTAAGAGRDGRGHAGAQGEDRSRRHVGVFFRPDLGIGRMSVSGGDTKFTGASGSFGLHVGGAVKENILLGAHLYDAVLVNPTVSVAGSSANTTDTTVAMVGFGPELTVYLAPANAYVSSTVALTRLTVASGGATAQTNLGFGARVSLGWEGWVSDRWGLGLAGQASYARNQDSGPDPVTFATWAFGVAFSATYD